jgi:hypothetical protein
MAAIISHHTCCGKLFRHTLSSIFALPLGSALRDDRGVAHDFTRSRGGGGQGVPAHVLERGEEV